MRAFDRSGCGALLLGALLVAGGPVQAFQDPTQVPAAKSERMLMSPMTAVTNIGSKTVAVGQRGHIALSDDGGRSWRQAEVPVSSDLVAVSFPTEQHGWAVGHGGVVLHSADGGETWVKQMDGSDATRLIHEYYGQGAGTAVENSALYLEREDILTSFGGTQPIMAVHFIDEKVGYIGGLFNRLFRTVDGGRTWEPWQHRIENPGELHFYAITADASAIYVTGEMGMVWRMRHDEDRFSETPTGYDGTLFGVLSTGDALLAFGMRGSLYRSQNAGDDWQRIDIGTQAGITSGAVLPNGAVLLGSLSGDVARSNDGGLTFEPVDLQRSMPFFGLAARPDGQLTLVGAAGVQHEAVKLPAASETRPSALVKNANLGTGNQRGSSHGYIN